MRFFPLGTGCAVADVPVPPEGAGAHACVSSRHTAAAWGTSAGAHAQTVPRLSQHPTVSVP